LVLRLEGEMRSTAPLLRIVVVDKKGGTVFQGGAGADLSLIPSGNRHVEVLTDGAPLKWHDAIAASSISF